MALLRMTVQVGGAGPLADTEANRRRLFVFARNSGEFSSTVMGNIRARMSRSSYAYDLNGPDIKGSISVTSFSPAQFYSDDLAQQPGLVDQISRAIEEGYIEVVDEAAPGTPLTRADLIAYL